MMAGKIIISGFYWWSLFEKVRTHFEENPHEGSRPALASGAKIFGGVHLPVPVLFGSMIFSIGLIS